MTEHYRYILGGDRHPIAAAAQAKLSCHPLERLDISGIEFPFQSPPWHDVVEHLQPIDFGCRPSLICARHDSPAVRASSRFQLS